MSTKLTMAQVVAWRAEAHELVATETEIGVALPACAVLDSAQDVADLCDALIEAWSDYHAMPALEPVLPQPGDFRPPPTPPEKT